MKKRSIFILVLVAVLVLAISTAALAKQINYSIKGEITTIYGDPPESIDILTGDGETVTVLLPDDFEDMLEVGYMVSFKGIWVVEGFEAEQMMDFYLEGVFTIVGVDTFTIVTGEGVIVNVSLPEILSEGLVDGDIVRIHGDWIEGVFVPTSVDVVDPEGEDDDDGEPGGRGGIYCDGGKDYPHPVAAKIASMYEADGVTPEWVMEQFCSGFGFGEIMLALKTQSLLAEEDALDARVILSMRVDMGWGQIWKTLGVSKSDKESNPPQGWLNKPDKESKTPPGLENKPDKGNKTPPGLVNKPEKVKGPKKP